jgi:hypothetical protein
MQQWNTAGKLFGRARGKQVKNEINFNVRISGQLKSDIESACHTLNETHKQLGSIRDQVEREMKSIEHQIVLLKDYWPLQHSAPEYLRNAVKAEKENAIQK